MKLAFFLFSHSRLTSKESGNSFRSIFKIFLELFTFHPCSAIVLIWIIISSCLICCNNILPGLISFTLDLYREFQTQKVERSRIICQIMSVPSLHACNGSPFFFFLQRPILYSSQWDLYNLATQLLSELSSDFAYSVPITLTSLQFVVTPGSILLVVPSTWFTFLPDKINFFLPPLIFVQISPR